MSVWSRFGHCPGMWMGWGRFTISAILVLEAESIFCSDARSFVNELAYDPRSVFQSLGI